MRSFTDKSVEIRRFETRDKGLLIDTITSVCAEGRWMRTTRYEPTPAWEHALAQPDCSCHLLLVAVDGERVVGWCRVFRDAGSQTDADIAIGLLSEYREQRLGSKLFWQAIAWTHEKGLTRLYLTARKDNARAIHLFEKFRFTVVRSLDENWIEMERKNPLGKLTQNDR